MNPVARARLAMFDVGEGKFAELFGGRALIGLSAERRAKLRPQFACIPVYSWRSEAPKEQPATPEKGCRFSGFWRTGWDSNPR